MSFVTVSEFFPQYRNAVSVTVVVVAAVAVIASV